MITPINRLKFFLSGRGPETTILLAVILPIILVVMCTFLRDYAPPVIGLNIVKFWPLVYALSTFAFIFAVAHIHSDVFTEAPSGENIHSGLNVFLPCVTIFCLVLIFAIYVEQDVFRDRPRNILRTSHEAMKEYKARYGHWPNPLENLYPNGPRWKRRAAKEVRFIGSVDEKQGTYEYPTYTDDNVPYGRFYPESGKFDESREIFP